MRIKPLLILFILLLAIGGGAYVLFGSKENPSTKTDEAHEEEGHGHEEGGEEHGGDETTISAETAANMGIETVQAGPATIRETRSLSGRIVLNQNTSAQVKARFPGIVRGVFKQAGDAVKRGEKLATVESNESLQVYAVTSPLDGVVLQRSISVGDEAAEEPIFEVADLSKLWVEFFVFANDATSITQGQAVRIRTLDDKLSADSTITALLPTADAASQTIIGRAVLDNADNAWRSGMTVRVDAVTSEQQVPLAVPTAALQRMEGKHVVFVKEGDEYKAVPVKTSLHDREMTEITDGLTAGAEVVSKNSFLVKADIGKAGAAHED